MPYENCDKCLKCLPCPVTSGDREEGSYSIAQGTGDIWYCSSCFYCEDICPDYSPRQHAIDKRRKNELLSERMIAPLKDLRKQGQLFNLTKSLNDYRIDSNLPVLPQPNINELDILYEQLLDEKINEITKPNKQKISDFKEQKITLEKNIGIALFLGCLIPYRVLDYEKSARNVLNKLEIDFCDLPFACCGSIMTESYSEELWLTIGAYNLALAEENGITTIISLCGGCTGNLRRINNCLKKNPEKLEVVNNYLKSINKQYTSSVTIKHLSEFLYDLPQNNFLQSKLKKEHIEQLSKLTAAIQIPCQVVRPEKESPKSSLGVSIFTEILEPTMIKFVHYPFEELCCGSSILQYNEELAYSIAKKRIDNLVRKNINLLILGCGNCSMNFTVHQKEYSTEKINTIFYTEILDYAMGSENKEIEDLLEIMNNKSSSD